jgi:hypothetical protein
MWTHDKKLLTAYRECMANVNSQLNEKEEVDFEGMCATEMNKMMGYTNAMLNEWEAKNSIKVSEKKQLFFTPKLPYYQNL